MNFESLRIENFGSIKEVFLPLSNQGLVLIVGRNEDAPKADSNGSGKSLILDGFSWAMWGQTVRGITNDEVVNNKVGSDCKVSVVFTDGSQKYEVIRLRKNTKDKNHKPNDLILKHNGVEVSGSSMAETQAYIEELIGLDFVTFCAMMPGAGASVASMTDAQVKLLLEKLLRTEVLGKASDEARKRHRMVSNDLLVGNAALAGLSSSIEDCQNRIASLLEKEANYTFDVLEKRDSILYRISLLEKRRDTLNKIISDKSALDLIIETAKSRIETVNSSIRTNDIKLHNSDIEHTNRVNNVQIEVSLAKRTLQELTSIIDKLKEVENNICSTCQQEVPLSQREALERKKRIANTNLLSITRSLEATKAVCDHETQDLKSIKEEQIKLRDSYIKNLNDLKAKRAEVDTATVELVNNTLQLNQLKESLQESYDDVNPYSSLILEETILLDSKNKEKDSLIETISSLEEEKSILDFWVDSFSPSGIRSFMLEHITPILNSSSKKYSDLITGGEMELVFQTKEKMKNGKVKEKFNVQVAQRHGGTSYASNSSGERARANLIIALALGELAAMRASKTIPFRFLDEPFESVDESGTEAIVALLNQQKEKYNTVYVITHQDYLQQMFEKKLTIVKKDGYSVLQEE